MRWFLLIAIALLPRTGLCADMLSAGQLLYVPVYSHIYTGDAERPFNLAVTLSVRNTDPHAAIRIDSVDYYDTAGHLIRQYLDMPVTLAPLASTRFVVAEKDTAGGSGANFMVRWQADRAVNPPVVETVMIGAKSGQGISFTSPAREIREQQE